MSFSATVFRVLVASPSDVAEERNAVASAIHDWNSHNSKLRGIVLLPVMWETHAAPLLGDRPQEVINDQIVRECDLLVGVFWTRIGSPTGEAESGTVEEINWFVGQKKPVMLYFSERDLPKECDLEQVGRLRTFKKGIQQKGLVFDYENAKALENMLFKQLTTVIERMNVTPTVNVAELRKATKDANSETPALKPAAQTSDDDEQISLCDYTEKSFVVVGNTLAFKEKFKEWNGKWMKARDGRHVWMFAKKSNLERVAKLLKFSTNLSPYPMA